MKLNVVNSKKKIKWIATIRNYNKFSMKLSKYIGWKRLSEKNSCTKIIKKYYNINKGLYFRLTFDNNIVSLSNSRLYSTSLNSGWRECLAGFTILEVKFESSIPAWFQRIVQIYQLQIRSISKFVIATDTLGLASDFERK